MNTLILYATIEESFHNFLIEEKMPLLPTDFQKEILAYTNWHDAQRSLLGRLLLHEGMDMMKLPFKQEQVFYNDFKKPILKNSNVKFNISHSGNLVVCAIIEKHNIGIDIEQIRAINWKEFKSQMTDNEIALVATSKDKSEAFFDYWTKKEAALKAHGKGLSVALPSFEIVNGETEIEDCQYFISEVFLGKGFKSHLAINNDFDISSIDIKEVDFGKK